MMKITYKEINTTVRGFTINMTESEQKTHEKLGKNSDEAHDYIIALIHERGHDAIETSVYEQLEHRDDITIA